MCDVNLDDGTAAVFESSFPKAAKGHKCCVCNTTIPKGQTYLRHKSLFEGRWQQDKACQDCAAVWTYFFQAHGGGYSPYHLWDMVEGCIDGVLNAETRIWRKAKFGMERRLRLAKATP